MKRIVVTLCSAGLALAGSIGLGCALGCASEQKAMSWDEVGDTAPIARASKTAPETQADFDAAAQHAISAQLCEDQARELLRMNKKKGAMMMLGCLKRPDFTSLLYFTQAPWKGFRFTEADYPTLLDLSMRRGGSQVSEDFQQLGIQVQPLDLFLADDNQPDSALVVTRVQVLKSQQVGAEYRAEARVYTYAQESGYQKKTVSYGRGSYSYTQKENELVGVRPAGVTVELVSNEPLPKDRRFEIVARFAKSRTKALQAQRNKEANALTDSGIDPGTVTDPKADPPPTVALKLVAAEKKVGAAVELQGGKNTAPADPYSSYGR